jgi:hypothetical protein
MTGTVVCKEVASYVADQPIKDFGAYMNCLEHGRNNHICRVCHDIPIFSVTYVAMHDDIPTFCQQLSVDSIII